MSPVLQINTLNLEQAGRAIKVGIGADVPVTLVSRPGIGKSTKTYSVADEVRMGMYDYNLSDKEGSDIGGIPHPVDAPLRDPFRNKGGSTRIKVKGPLTAKRLEYLIASGLLPFDTEESCILFLDELDRAQPDTQNMAQRIILDRRVNGHVLSPNCRIVCAMNGATDRYTNELSEALRTRMCFVYIETASEGALKSYLDYAATSGVSDLMRGFARFRKEVFLGDPRAAERPFVDMAMANPRVWDMVDKVVRVAEQLSAKFPTEDIIPALVTGLVGNTTGAIEFIGYRDTFARLPRVEDVIKRPITTEIPMDPGVLFAFSLTLANVASGNREAIKPISEYGLRWPNEQAAFLFTTLAEKVPTVVTTPAYQQWNRRNDQ